MFADADLEEAAAAAPLAVFGNAGQDCCARSRILVERSAVDRFMTLLEKSRSRRCGRRPPRRRHTRWARSSRPTSATKVSVLRSTARPRWRSAAARPTEPGYWFPPIVLCPVSNDDRAAREEIFGPIAAVIPFEGEEEAIRLANDTIYGLSGSIWTTNGARALRVARALESGALSVNSNTSVRVGTPFGGFKQSGIGRELGPHALDYYTELKNVYIAT